MAFCTDHQQFFHAEINENCPTCEAIQAACPHRETKVESLFGSRTFLGLQGEWENCVQCGKLIRVDVPRT